jgi:hypothetical protein
MSRYMTSGADARLMVTVHDKRCGRPLDGHPGFRIEPLQHGCIVASAAREQGQRQGGTEKSQAIYRHASDLSSTTGSRD